MAKPSQVAKNEGSHVLLYGEPKSGKSTIVSELILKGYKLWWISLDNGHEIIYKLKVSAEYLDQHVELFKIPDTREFPVAVAVVRAIMTGGETFICDAHGQPGCSVCKKAERSFSRICLNEFGPKDILVIDHSGQLSESTMAYLTRNVKNVEEYKPSFTDYMNQGTILAGIFSNIQQSQANIIVITHTVEAELEDGSKRIVPQTGTANFSRNVSKYFGHVIYLRVANKTHKIGSSTTYDSSAITGSRTDIVIESMKEPTLAPFFDGTIKAIKKEEHGTSVAAKILETPTVKVEQKVTEEVAPEKSPEQEPEHPLEKEVTQHVVEKTLSLKEKLALLNRNK